MNEVSVIMTLLVIYLIAILAGIAVNVLLALAAYQDARARGNQNATMWGVLIGILGWIRESFTCVRVIPQGNR